MTYGVNAPLGLVPYNNSSDTNRYSIYASADGVTTQAISMYQGDPVMFSQQGVGQIQAGTITQLSWQIATTVTGVSVYYYAGATNANPSQGPFIGVFSGCTYTLPTGQIINSNYWPGGTIVQAGSAITAYVYDDPSIIYDIQVSTPTTLPASACFPNIATAAQYRAISGVNLALDGVSGGAWATGNYPLNPGGLSPYQFGIAVTTASPAAGIAGNSQTGISSFYAVTSTVWTPANPYGEYLKSGTVAAPSAYLPLKVIGLTPTKDNLDAYQLGLSASVNPPYQNSQPFLNILVKLNNTLFASPIVGQTTV